MMLMSVADASPIGYTELKSLDIYEFMLLYNQLIQDAQKKKK